MSQEQSQLAIIEQVQMLSGAGRDQEAHDLLQKALRRGASPMLDNAMAITLVKLGKLEQAVFFAERAATAGDPGTLLTLGNIQFLAGRADLAAATYERVVASGAREAGVLLGLAHCLRDQRSYDAAAERLQAALAIEDSAGARAMLADAYQGQRRHAEAWSVLKEAAERYPDDLIVASGAANLANYQPDLSAQECEEAQLRYGRLLARLTPADPRPLANDRDPERKLRVGFLSPDLRQHSVAYFIEPVLKHLPRDRFRVGCYALHRRDDAVSVRLRKLADTWTDVSTMNDAQIVDRVRADAIDVLIDLSGHTRGHRLGVFQRRGAPVQAAYLGYPNITGVANMDARIVDEISDPPGSALAAGSERLVRVASPFICYTPDPAAPLHRRAVGDAGPESGSWPGPVFASFNLAAKINHRVMAAWARILERAPGSTLLIKASDLAAESMRELLLDQLATAGIARERVRVLPPTKTVGEHLALYAGVDIALDTFPYNGTTTTCEALWQGVPVVTLAGDRHASRVGASLLTSVGLAELVAMNEEEYVQRAVMLAGDRDRLTSLRGSLRQNMLEGRLCDGPGFGARFGEAIRTLWRERCSATA